jgi:NAD(P)H dehydrogenase (quinone)
MTVVISGASGQFGRRAAQRVLETLPPNQLILVTRRPDALRDLAERGVVVRRGDFNDPDSLPDAFAGGDKLLLISTDALGSRVMQHGAAIKAAVRAGMRSIAYTSAVNPTESNPMAVAVEHRATEEAVRASGLAWTFLRNSIYADLLPRAAAQALATGQLIHNEGDGRTSYVARRGGRAHVRGPRGEHVRHHRAGGAQPGGSRAALHGAGR